MSISIYLCGVNIGGPVFYNDYSNKLIKWIHVYTWNHGTDEGLIPKTFCTLHLHFCTFLWPLDNKFWSFFDCILVCGSFIFVILTLSIYTLYYCISLLLCDALGGQTDRMDLIRKDYRLLHVQKSNVSVQVFLPVVFRVDNDFINGHNLLSAPLIPDSERNRKEFKTA